MFGLRKKNLVGLDIDTTAVRMVQLQREENGYAVGGARSTEIAPGGMIQSCVESTPSARSGRAFPIATSTTSSRPAGSRGGRPEL